MNKKNLCILAVGSIFAISLTSCGGGTSNSGKPSNNPFDPSGGGSQNASERLDKALAKDYSNMTVEWESYTKAADDGNYGLTYYYNGYMIVAPTTEYDTNYYYYHDYQGETYLYFTPDTNYVGEGEAPEAWLSHGYNDVSLEPSLTEFVMKNFLQTITTEICTYEASLDVYYVNSTVVDEVGRKILGFAWDNDVDQIMFSLDSDGNIAHIRGFDTQNEDDYVAVELSKIGSTTFDNSKLPTAPNATNVMEYWQYKGLPYKDADKIFINSLSLSKVALQSENYESTLYGKQILKDITLAKEGEVYKAEGYELSFVETTVEEVTTYSGTFKFDGDRVEELTQNKSLSTAEIIVLESRNVKLSIVKSGDNLIIKSRYMASAQEVVEIDKTTLVAVDMLPIDATITGLVWKSSNSAVLAVDNNANGTVVRKGVQQFIAKPVEVDTTVEVWCEAEKARDGEQIAISNKVSFKVKAIAAIDKEGAKNDLYFTKITNHTSAPMIANESYASIEALDAAYPYATYGTDEAYEAAVAGKVFYIEELNALYKFWEFSDDKYHEPKWITMGTCEETVLTMKDTVADDVLVGEIGKCKLYDVANANAGLFTGTRKILGFEPSSLIQPSGHSYPCYAMFKVNDPVSRIMFNYGAIYNSDKNGLSMLNGASISYSADGVTWKSIDILDEMKSDLSENTLRLMDKNLDEIENVQYIKIEFYSGNIGSQFRIGVQNIVLK